MKYPTLKQIKSNKLGRKFPLNYTNHKANEKTYFVFKFRAIFPKSLIQQIRTAGTGSL